MVIILWKNYPKFPSTFECLELNRLVEKLRSLETEINTLNPAKQESLWTDSIESNLKYHEFAFIVLKSVNQSISQSINQSINQFCSK